MNNPFTRHPRSIGKSYFSHMLGAFGYVMGCLYAAFAAFIHAFFPFLFETTAGDKIEEMYKKCRGL